MLLDGRSNRRQYSTHTRTTGSHTAETDTEATHILQQRSGGRHTQMIAAVQQANQRTQAWPKRSWRHLRRQIGGDGVLAGRTTDGLLLIFGDARLERRQFPDLVDPDWAAERQFWRKCGLTV